MQIDRRLVGASVWLAMSVTCGGVAFAAEIPTPGEQYQAAIAASYTAIETTGVAGINRERHLQLGEPGVAGHQGSLAAGVDGEPGDAER